MYWIQEIGDANRADQKLFYAEYQTDVPHIGDGDVSYTADNSAVTAAPAKYGDQVLCLEDSTVSVYQTDKTWKQI